MTSSTDHRSLHADELAALTRRVHALGSDQLTVATPCAGWRVADLLAHSIGQHRGFAVAARDGDAPAEAYDWVPHSLDVWDRSVAELVGAFASVEPDRRVHQVELRPDGTMPVSVLVTAQLLDTAVHHWDLAVALGGTYEPPSAAIEAIAAMAARIPADGRSPGSAFGPRIVALPSTDPSWSQVLAHLGRDPGAAGAA